MHKYGFRKVGRKRKGIPDQPEYAHPYFRQGCVDLDKIKLCKSQGNAIKKKRKAEPDIRPAKRRRVDQLLDENVRLYLLYQEAQREIARLQAEVDLLSIPTVADLFPDSLDDLFA